MALALENPGHIGGRFTMANQDQPRAAIAVAGYPRIQVASVVEGDQGELLCFRIIVKVAQVAQILAKAQPGAVRHAGQN